MMAPAIPINNKRIKQENNNETEFPAFTNLSFESYNITDNQTLQRLNEKMLRICGWGKKFHASVTQFPLQNLTELQEKAIGNSEKSDYKKENVVVVEMKFEDEEVVYLELNSNFISTNENGKQILKNMRVPIEKAESAFVKELKVDGLLFDFATEQICIVIYSVIRRESLLFGVCQIYAKDISYALALLDFPSSSNSAIKPTQKESNASFSLPALGKSFVKLFEDKV